MVEEDLEHRIARLEKNLNILADNYKKTNEQLDILQNNVDEFKELKVAFNENVENINDINNKIERISSIIKGVEDLKDVKSNIFSVMALFFGMFAFISIDIGVTKSLLSYFAVVKDTIYIESNTLYGLIASIILSQIIFFICIYNFLLAPFLNKVNSEIKIPKVNYYSLGVISIILVGIIIFIAVEKSHFEHKQDKFEKQIKVLSKNFNTKIKPNIK